MVDGAPAPAEVLPEVAELLEGRVLVAHSASFDRRVLAPGVRARRARLARARPRSARSSSPAASPRWRAAAALAPLADAPRHRGRARCTARCPTRSPARACSARCSRACARTRSTVGRGARPAALAPARRARPSRPSGSRRPSAPTSRRSRTTPGVYVFRDDRGRPLYVGKSVSLRSRARAHFCAPAGWTERAEIVDYRPTNSELGRARAREPADQGRGSRPATASSSAPTGTCSCAAGSTSPIPVLEVAAAPAGGHAVNVGPLGSRALAAELADQLTSLYRLRHCGRTLHLREHPSAYGQMGRCVSPCLGDLDPNAYRRQLDVGARPVRRARAGRAAARGDRPPHRRGVRRPALRARRRAAAPARPAGLGARAARGHPARHPRGPAAAAGAPPGQAALRRLLDRARAAGRLGAAARATPSSWSAPQAALARARAAARATPVPADEVDELRIVWGWLADNEPPELALDPAPDAGRRSSASWPRRPSRRRPLAGARSRSRLWVVSQNGLVAEPPQRQRTIGSPSLAEVVLVARRRRSGGSAR